PAPGSCPPRGAERMCRACRSRETRAGTLAYRLVVRGTLERRPGPAPGQEVDDMAEVRGDLQESFPATRVLPVLRVRPAPVRGLISAPGAPALRVVIVAAVAALAWASVYSAGEDLQAAVHLYEAKKAPEAKAAFTEIARRDPK